MSISGVERMRRARRPTCGGQYPPKGANILRGARTLAGRAIVGALIIAAWPASADIRSGVEAYKSGDYETALREFRELAAQGELRAQYNLGIMYMRARGVEKDMAKAVDWQRRAAEGGLAAAQHGLGVMFYRGEGVEQDYAEAARWFRRAADQGFTTSQLNLGVMYFSGLGVERNDAEVVKWVTLAAAGGLPQALFRLGVMYERGSIFPENLSDAAYWYGRSAERGHDEGRKRAEALKEKAGKEAAPVATDEKSAPAAEATETTPTVTVSISAGMMPTPAPAALETTPIPVMPAADGGKPLGDVVPDDARIVADSADPEIVAASPGKTHGEKAAMNAAPAKPASLDPDAAWQVQLAAFRSEREARRAWNQLKRTHARALGSLRLVVSRVDLGPAKGVFHRLKAGPLDSRADAFALCRQLKSRARGQGCIPLPPRR